MEDGQNNADAQMWAIADERKRKGQTHQKQYQESSKRRLMTIAEKKLKTTFIGNIDILEKMIGFMWGHGKPLSELTEDEKKWRDLWDEMRTEILNNGNNQLRALLNEISEYTISWNRYNLKTIMRNEDGEDQKENR